MKIGGLATNQIKIDANHKSVFYLHFLFGGRLVIISKKEFFLFYIAFLCWFQRVNCKHCIWFWKRKVC